MNVYHFPYAGVLSLCGAFWDFSAFSWVLKFYLEYYLFIIVFIPFNKAEFLIKLFHSEALGITLAYSLQLNIWITELKNNSDSPSCLYWGAECVSLSVAAGTESVYRCTCRGVLPNTFQMFQCSPPSSVHAYGKKMET